MLAEATQVHEALCVQQHAHRYAVHRQFLHHGVKRSRRNDQQYAARISRPERKSGGSIPAPDLIAYGLDLVIRVGVLKDSSLFSCRLGAIPMVVCVAKSYLQQHGTLEKPADVDNFT